MTEILNENLTLDTIPLPNTGWGEIGLFALSFNGYDHWGGFEACGDVSEKCRKSFLAGQGLANNLTVLRTSLFFEQRRWRHYGYDPDEAGMEYILALLEGIRQKVKDCEFE